MKFKELREADLSKAQIKKVHDKADDLPKNDFIKRYGKEGDSVRFATATKMVKKELGIEDYEEGFKSDAQRKAAFASGYKEKGKKKEEVEVTEAVSDAYVKQIARMTDRNDHFGARFELARLMKDKQLMGFYDSLEKMHTTLPRGVIGNDAITIRQRLERLLRDRLKSKLKADADKLIDAL